MTNKIVHNSICFERIKEGLSYYWGDSINLSTKRVKLFVRHYYKMHTSTIRRHRIHLFLSILQLVLVDTHLPVFAHSVRARGLTHKREDVRKSLVVQSSVYKNEECQNSVYKQNPKSERWTQSCAIHNTSGYNTFRYDVKILLPDTQSVSFVQVVLDSGRHVLDLLCGGLQHRALVF